MAGTDVTIDSVHFRPLFSQGQPNCDIKLGDGAQDVRINDNNFDGYAGPYSAICGADDSSVGGVEYAQHARGVLITNNFFKGYSRPLYFHSIDNVTIQGNIIRDTLRDAIRLRENDGYTLINGNHFINIGNDPASMETQDAVDTFWSGYKLIISDNVVRGTSGVGFDIKGVAPDNMSGSHNIIIANNQIADTLYSAIVFHGDFETGSPTHSLLVEGNVIENTSTSAILGNAAIWIKGAARYITLANNQVVSNKNRGITVQTRSGQFDGSVKGLQVLGNTVVNNGIATEPSSIGIYIQGVDGLTLSNNIVTNDSQLPNPEQKFGIYITPQQTADNAIIRNNISRCHAYSNITTVGRSLDPADNLTAASSGCH
ncbi:MAG: right-handed parallel beta-helix repeat-containing protein [Thiolinea sp.]